jgi:hypothetical protein
MKEKKLYCIRFFDNNGESFVAHIRADKKPSVATTIKALTQYGTWINLDESTVEISKVKEISIPPKRR